MSFHYCLPLFVFNKKCNFAQHKKYIINYMSFWSSIYYLIYLHNLIHADNSHVSTLIYRSNNGAVQINFEISSPNISPTWNWPIF